MDANFAVFFDEEDKKFYYYVQRLVGVEVEFEQPDKSNENSGQ